MRIYIHIPFCESKCNYCAFTSLVNKNQIKEYFNALKLDLLRFLPFKKSIKSIYFGGGTPSFVDANYYEEIFSILKDFLAANCEISAEANPNSLTPLWLEQMQKYGLNRISLGVQSFNDEKLKFLNRTHKSSTAIAKIKLLKSFGINYSIDIIYGTFLDDLNNLNYELETLNWLELNHLSAYTLILENNTPFAKKYDFLQKNEELNCYFYENLQKINLIPYEVSNFAKNDAFICKHNLSYWNKENYLGIGLSSVGTTENKRYYATTNLSEYIKNPYKRKKEILSNEDIKFERIFLGLRSCVGVDLALVNAKKLDNLKGFFLIKNGKIYNKNYLLSDELAIELSSAMLCN